MRKIWIGAWLFIMAWMGIQPAHAKDLVPIRVGYIPVLNQLPLVVAYENYRLRLPGIDFQLVKYSSYMGLEAAVRVGAIDVASLPFPKIFRIAGDGIPITLMGVLHKGGSTLVMRNQGEPSSFLHKLIGVPGLDSTENLLLTEWLSQKKLKYGLDYKTIGIPFHMAPSYLEQKKLDGVFLPEPMAAISQSNHIAQPVWTAQDGLRERGFNGLIVNSAMLRSHSNALTKWLKGVLMACRFISSDIRLSSSRQTAIIQEPYMGYSEQLVSTLLASNGGIMRFDQFFPNPKVLGSYAEMAFKMNLTPKLVTPESFYSMAPLRNALMD